MSCGARFRGALNERSTSLGTLVGLPGNVEFLILGPLEACIDGLKAKAPDWDWALMLRTAGLDKSPTVLMTNNTALTAEGKIFTDTPVQVWKDYLTAKNVATYNDVVQKFLGYTSYASEILAIYPDLLLDPAEIAA